MLLDQPKPTAIEFMLEKIGYKSIPDMLASLFQYKAIKVIMILAIPLGTLAGILHRYIGLDAELYLAFNILIILEFITRFFVEKINLANKILWTCIKVFIYTSILFVLNTYRQHSEGLQFMDLNINFYTWTYYIVFHGLTIHIFIKCFENMVKAGWDEASGIKGLIIKFISTRLGVEKIVKAEQKNP